MIDTPKRAAARDAVVSAAMSWWASGAPSAAQSATLARACEDLYAAHRPPGLMCVPCDGLAGAEHAIDCPMRTLTGGAS